MSKIPFMNWNTSHWMSKRIAHFLAIASILSLVLFAIPPTGIAYAAGTTYYVDSVGGSDSNSGTSPTSPWATLSKVNSTTFAPGDKILFHAGNVWTGLLHPLGSGVSGSPISIDMYGGTIKPLIQANGLYNDTVLLQNQQYWEINNLEVTNNAGSSPYNLGDYRGIHISAVDYGGTLNHIYINNVYVHNITGEVNWVGGSSANDPPGIHHGTGDDRSKRTGGIIVEASTNNPTSPVLSTFNDVVVQNSRIEDTSFGGIIFKQYSGTNPGATYVGWGDRKSATDTNWKPFTNITVQNNYVSGYNTDYGCNGIYVTATKGAIIQNNVVAGVGTSGIEVNYTDDVIIQKNEVYDTIKKAGGVDDNGIDPDRGTTNIIVQYNYLHHNGDGILFCQRCYNGFGGSAIVRYNILESNTGAHFHIASSANVQIYNNTVYNDSSTTLVGGHGSSYNIRNNIFYSTVSGATLDTGSGNTYSYNLYNNVSAIPSTDTHAIVGDPKLVNPGTGGTGTALTGPALYSLGGYRLQSTSPVINTGTSISSNGGTDFWGNPLYNGLPDMGAYEYYNDTTPPTTPTNLTATAVSDSEIGLSWTASTDNLNVFKYLIYRNGTQVGSTLGSTLYQDKGLAGSTSYSYTVYAEDSTGNISPVSNTATATTQASSDTTSPTAPANLTVTSVSGSVIDLIWTASTDNVGVTRYLIERGGTQVAIISGSTTSYEDKDLAGLTSYSYKVYAMDAAGNLSPASNTAAATTTTNAPTITTYTINDSFDNDAAGSAPSGWTISNGNASNSVTVAANPSSTNHSANINKPVSSGLTGMYRTFTPLSGEIIVNYRVMRGETNTWFSLPYLYDSAGNVAASVAFNNGQIQVNEGGTFKNIQTFSANTWYDVELVLNTTTGTFDLYINGTKSVSGAPLRTNVSSVSKIQYYADTNNTGTAYLDYIQIGKNDIPSITTYTINDSFDNDAAGSQPSGWTLTNGNASNSITVVENPGPSNHSAKINKPNSSGLTGMYKTFAPLSGQVIVNYRVMRGDTSTFFSLPYIYDSADNKVLSLAFNNGNIQAFEGSTLTTIQPFSANTWYNIEAVLNTTTDTFDLYINGTKVVSGAALRTAVSSVSKIQFYADNTNYGTAYLDYVQVGQ